jgi:hypothetical protein
MLPDGRSRRCFRAYTLVQHIHNCAHVSRFANLTKAMNLVLTGCCAVCTEALLFIKELRKRDVVDEEGYKNARQPRLAGAHDDVVDGDAALTP